VGIEQGSADRTEVGGGAEHGLGFSFGPKLSHHQRRVNKGYRVRLAARLCPPTGTMLSHLRRFARPVESTR
jgi:hypothetical protein